MKFLFFFLDGIGLGSPDPAKNPFARANMPVLQNLLAGKRLLASTIPLESRRASLLALDACLGVDGLPQSATGQTALLTGINAARHVGRHVEGFPGPELKRLIRQGTLKSGKPVARTRVGSDAIRAAPSVVGDRLYVLGADGEFAVITLAKAR